MTINNLQKVIFNALDNMMNTNQQLFEYWYSELFDLSDEPILEMWNEQNLYQMEKDVMHQLQD